MQGRLRDRASSEYFPYKTIKFSGQLEMLDQEGRVAVFRRQQRIRFLEDGVGIFFDRVWGSGVLFAGYSAASLRILEPIRTKDGYVLPLALPRMYARGETFDIVTTRRIVGAFIEEASYWDSAMSAPTDLLTIKVIGHRSRPFRHPELIVPQEGDMDATTSRNMFNFRVKHPATNIPYKLVWSWN